MSEFKCEKDKDVEMFLRDKAILFEKKYKSRTYLILDEKELELGSIKILGYFSLALKNLKIPEKLSKTFVKRMDGLYKNIENIPVFLIGQLAKNDYCNDFISGKEIIDYAVSIIYKAFKYVGGRIILIEVTNKEKLIRFYLENEFMLLDNNNDNNNELLQMIRFITD